MSWIPFGYIFQTNMIELILNNFVVPNTTRIEAIKCFTEIASLDFSEMDPAEQRALKEKVCLYFCLFVSKIAEVTKNRSLVDEYKSIVGSKAQNGFENFCRQVALAITAVIKSNIDLIEETTNTMDPNPNIQFL
jgi:exportin-1